jgi:hypothetical protein
MRPSAPAGSPAVRRRAKEHVTRCCCEWHDKPGPQRDDREPVEAIKPSRSKPTEPAAGPRPAGPASCG